MTEGRCDLYVLSTSTMCNAQRQVRIMIMTKTSYVQDDVLLYTDQPRISGLVGWAKCQFKSMLGRLHGCVGKYFV